MMLYLHEKCGYNFFNIPDLTYPEINSLVESKNRQMKKQEQEQKRAERKSKSGKGRFR